MSERERAWDYLLRLLSYRPRTEAEVRERLRRKGFAPEVTQEILSRAREEGLLDDAAFAKLYVEDRLLSNPRSKRLIERELRGKGVDPHLARRAVAEGTRGVSDEELAREALRRRLARLRGLPRETALRRAYSYLARRGFPQEICRRVVEELLGGGSPDG